MSRSVKPVAGQRQKKGVNTGMSDALLDYLSTPKTQGYEAALRLLKKREVL